MEEKFWFYWVAGEDGDDSDKRYFQTTDGFLEFLQGNDPTLVGATAMTQTEFNALPKDDESTGYPVEGIGAPN